MSPCLRLTAVVVLVAAAAGTGPTSPRPPTGVNWPDAGRLYLLHDDEDNRAGVLDVVRQHDIYTVRVLLADGPVLKRWQTDPTAVLTGVRELIADAAAQHVRLVIGEYLTQQAVEGLAGHGYRDWPAAQRDLTTRGSAPWLAYQRWIDSVGPLLGGSDVVRAVEVVNEPGWMLGADAGNVSVDAAVGFMSHFAARLQAFGVRTSSGGRPLYDPSRLTDAQLWAWSANLDLLDDHLYPTENQTSPGQADASAAVTATAAWFGRVRRLTERPALPGELGEVGSQPAAWTRTVLQGGARHGWQVLLWGYNAHDANNFSATHRPEVLDDLGRRNSPSSNT